ncbi:MAG: acylphosphatase [Planctomycetota bacterium]|jgi:acylphosphatase
MGLLLSLGVLDMAETTRLTAFFSGSVQGVGFRFTTQNIASRLPVTGYVKNLLDGRVELVAEGERSAIEGLMSGIRSELGRGIENEEFSWENPSSEFRKFDIQY